MNKNHIFKTRNLRFHITDLGNIKSIIKNGILADKYNPEKDYYKVYKKTKKEYLYSVLMVN